MEPKITQGTGCLDEKEYDHPSYAMIGASRISGRTRLVGSDLVHNHFVAIRLVRAKKQRSLARDWWSGSASPIVEVYMSEAQWASFVSSMNVGSGIPCTLKRGPSAETKSIDYPAVVEKSNHELHKEELSAQAKVISVELRKAIMAFDDLLNDKSVSKKELKERIETLKQASMHVDVNLAFNVEQHKEFMEKTVCAAKSEVEGYVVGVVQALGIEALKKTAPMIEEK